MASSSSEILLEPAAPGTPKPLEAATTESFKRKADELDSSGSNDKVVSSTTDAQPNRKKRKSTKSAVTPEPENSASKPVKRKTTGVADDAANIMSAPVKATRPATRRKRKADDAQITDAVNDSLAIYDGQPPAKKSRKKADPSSTSEAGTRSTPEASKEGTDESSPLTSLASSAPESTKHDVKGVTRALEESTVTKDNPQQLEKQEAAKPATNKAKRTKATPKPKANGARAKKTETLATPKTKRTRKTKQQAQEPTLPPPQPPVKVSVAVANKIKQVKDYIAMNEESNLERDALNDRLITVPESTLLGAVMHMRTHYEIGSQEDASIQDIQEAIVDTIKRPIGLNPEPIEWKVVNVSKATLFEIQIKEKVSGHGLDDVSLLEIELELVKLRELEWAGVYDTPKIFRNAENYLEAMKEVLYTSEDVAIAGESSPAQKEVGSSPQNRVDSKVSEEEAVSEVKPEQAEDAGRRASAGSDEREVGKAGVCVAPVHGV